ncbi:MAG: FtsX-like permease family protein [Proteocatella sp.]
MIFKLAKKNIKMNIQHYLLYFMASIFNIAIYFSFQSIWFNKNIGGFLKEDGRLLLLFKGASFVILIFSVIFIGYFSSFFIRKRKKEIGLYSLLGMKKIDISKLLFFENISLGLFATISGIILGILLSKILMEILITILGASLNFGFELPIYAVVNTFWTFVILFFVSGIYTSFTIYKFKLIDLFNADKATENIGTGSKSKNIVGAIITIVLILIELWAVINIKDSNTFYISVPLAFFASLIATFMFFDTFLSFVGNKLKSNKKLYYRGDNLISISSFLYRIKSNKRLLSVIALTNAVALTAISMTYSLDYNMREIKELTSPFSYSYISNDDSLDGTIEEIINSYPEHKIISHQKIEISEAELISKNDISNGKDKLYLISESEYKKALESKGLSYESKLVKDRDAILLEYYSRDVNLDEIKDITVGLEGFNTEFEVKEISEIAPLNEMKSNPIFLVKDEVYKKYQDRQKNKIHINAYKVTNEIAANKLTKALIKALPEDSRLSYSQEMNSVLIFTSMLLFVGIFVGFVFLSSTASILYFKQLSEATDDKKRYQILNKIGFSSKDVKISIKKQVISIFVLPVLIGVLHTVIALIFLSSITELSIFVPITTSIMAYMLIYFLYYVLTVNSYVRIVTEN